MQCLDELTLKVSCEISLLSSDNLSEYIMRYKLEFALFWLLAIVLAYLVGVRDVSVGADTSSYQNIFFSISSCQCLGEHEVGFGAFSLLVSYLSRASEFFFFSISILIFWLLYLACKGVKDYCNWQEQKYFLIWTMSFFLINPLFLQANINALRHGVAAMLLVVAFTSFSRKANINAVIFYVLSVLFHYSSILLAPFLLIFLLPVRYLLPAAVVIYAVLFAVYILGWSEYLVFLYAPDIYKFVSEYGYTVSSRYDTGIRFDFALFTSFILFFAALLLAVSRRNTRAFFARLFSCAIVSTYPFFVLGWGFFSNRYLYAGWIVAWFIIGALMFDFFRGYKSVGAASVIALAASTLVFVIGVV